MSTPLVTVVIPSFNHGRYIDEAVGSALASEIDGLEVVIVDDGSTDETGERLRAMATDPQVRVYEQENQGAHAALNRALSLATGEFIFILDSDDAFVPQRVPRLVEALRSDRSAAIAASWIQIVDADGKELGVKEGWSNLPPWPPPSSGPYLTGLGDPVLALLETNYISTTSNLALRREMIDRHGLRFLALRYAHDWDFILSACRHGGIALVEEPLIRYRVHGDNTIKEGAQAGVGAMRFDIQWTVARHAYQVLKRSNTGLAMDELVRLAWNSMPSFGCDAVLDQLLVLRGTSPAPPPAYDGLLDAGQPFREAAIQTLASAP
jgi:glycosyltransferase involved in cell wall biosynthesis